MCLPALSKVGAGGGVSGLILVLMMSCPGVAFLTTIFSFPFPHFGSCSLVSSLPTRDLDGCVPCGGGLLYHTALLSL